jgi:hypothetical protein
MAPSAWIDRAVQEPDPEHTRLILAWDFLWDLALVFVWHCPSRQWVVQSEYLMEGHVGDSGRKHAFRLWLPVPAPLDTKATP